MSAVKNDFEQLRIFADRLKGYLQQIDDANTNLDQAFSELGEAWQDSQRVEFEKVYQELRDMLLKFHASADQQIPYILELAQILEDYHNTRTRM